MQLLTFCKICRSVSFSKFPTKICGTNIGDKLYGTDRKPETFEYLSPLKNDLNSDNNYDNSDEFKTLITKKKSKESPLKTYAPKHKDYRYYKNEKSTNERARHGNEREIKQYRPLEHLVKNENEQQLEQVREWFKENTTNGASSVHKWQQFSQKKKFGFSTQGEVLYGIHPVLNALRYQRRTLYKLFLQRRQNHDTLSPVFDEIVSLAKQADVSIEEIPRHTLEMVSNMRPHQGVCLDASPLPEVFHDVERDSSENLSTSKNPLWLVLYKIKDPMNVGAILRSAHFLSVDRVLITRNDSCPLTPVVSKASSGALESMSLYTVHCRLAELIKAQRARGWRIVTTSAPAEFGGQATPIETYRITQPTMLFIGNEGSGIPESIHHQCDDVLTIQTQSPGDVGVTSLNVSVATGIILHNLLSRRE